MNVLVHAAWDPDQADWANHSVTMLAPAADWTKQSQVRAVEVDLTALPQTVAVPQPSVLLPPTPSKREAPIPKTDPPGGSLSHELCAPVDARQPRRPIPGGKPAPAGSPTNGSPARATASRSFRIDAPHALADKHLHRKPAAPAEPPSPAAEPAKPAESAPQSTAAPAASVAALSAADAPPRSTASQAEALAPAAEAAPIAKKPCVPLWEVDHFLWPETCERLVHDDQSYFSQAGDKLQAALRDGLKTLAITGSRRGEGRSTLALCLARAAARAGVQVAVVDADFSRPQLAGMIGLDVVHSWQDAAIGKIPLSEAAIKSLSDKVTVLPLDGSAAGNPLSLSDPRITATLRALAATFELVILDLGPTTPGSEPLFPAGEACPIDAAVVVRDLRYASLPETRAVGERLHAAGIEAVGVAENFVAP
jgi:Mrp family chromosome partitioning ATPase